MIASTAQMESREQTPATPEKGRESCDSYNSASGSTVSSRGSSPVANADREFMSQEYECSRHKISKAENVRREPPVASFYLRAVPVYEEQDIFQHYDFTQVSGRGGYATVYIVQHLETGELFACKIVHTRECERYVERALKEACMQSILNDHPNVTTLREVWTLGLKHVFLVMDKCDGGEIFDAIVARGALPEKDSANILRVILQLIRYCHCKGMIHHDWKPENLMFKDKDKPMDKNNIRAIDFGCTAFYDEPTKKLSGTPLYAAPEIIQGPNHDYRADLWSAGVFLFCMLTGLMPFEGETNHDIKKAVLSQPIDFEEDPWPFVAEEAKDLCKRLLQRNIDDRISLDEALTHPWLKQLCLDEVIQETSHRSLQDILKGLQEFPSRSQLQKLLLLLYAHKFGAQHQERPACFSLFDWMDCDGNGKTSLNTFRHGMLGLQPDLPEAQIKEVFTSMLQINEARITFLEFHAATLHLRASDCPTLAELLSDSAHNATSLDDSSASQVSANIRIDDLRVQLPKAGGDFKKEIIEELMDSIDSEGCACISMHRLQAAWEECQVREEKHPNCQTEISSSSPAIDIEIQQVWQRASLQSNHNQEHSSVAGSSPVRGCSPATESSWDRMKLVRGGSPATIGYTGSENGMGGSPNNSSSLTWDGNFAKEDATKKEGFCSGGVMYWDGTESHPNWVEEENLDSDNLFGPALAAVQARHI